MLESDTAAPEPPGAFDNATVQVDVPLELRLAGLQDSALTTVRAAREMDADCEPPFKVAVTDAVWSAVIFPAVAVKVAVVLPAATVTVAGTVRSALLLLSETAAATLTALERVAVQVDAAADPRLVGLQDSRLTTAWETSEILADCEPPFKVAVSDPV
ncbi:MAG TPA: hypothetical protein VMJ34_13280 [Bryobacteraceae bacterium]|nr:hypothetical protein [Bryobacteraceae bacterium]